MKITLIVVTVVLVISMATVAVIGATGGFSTEPSPTATTTPTYSASPTSTLDDISWLAMQAVPGTQYGFFRPALDSEARRGSNRYAHRCYRFS